MPNLFGSSRSIAIEGPIRAGKSTLARLLAEHLNARTVIEPENNPFLDRFYQEESGMAFAAQMWFLMERYEQLCSCRETSEIVARPIVSDYIFEKDKLFAYVNLTDAELEIYNRYYQLLRKEIVAPDLVIYLQATPDVLKQRLKRKGVPGEQQISEKYLERIVAAYEHFFFHYTASDLLIINTSEIDFVNNPQHQARLLERISKPIKGTHYFQP